MATDAAEVLALPVLAERLPLPPDPAIDPVLDAASDYLARHGISKTMLSDIAREMGVAPSTVSRKVGSADNVTMLVFAREAQRFLGRIPATLSGAAGPSTITMLMVEAIETLDNHPVAAKVLWDEGDWMGRMVTRQLDHLLAHRVEVTAPFLTAAMAAGLVRQHLAHWILRIALAALAALVAPPPGDLRSALDDLLLPLLAPSPSR